MAARCFFCWTDVPSLSREHLLSEPIAKFAGIDRASFRLADSGVARGRDGVKVLVGRPPVPLTAVATKLACASCNSGWMSELEQRAARSLSSWRAQPMLRVGRTRLEVIHAWMLKSFFVLMWAHGGVKAQTKAFAQGGTDWSAAVVPDVRRALALANGRFLDACRGTDLAVVRTDSAVLHGYGNPTAVPVGPGWLNCRVAGVLAVTLGGVQLWLVVPLVPGLPTRFPEPVQRLHATTALADVPFVPDFTPDPTRVTVDVRPHGIQALSAAAPLLLLNRRVNCG